MADAAPGPKGPTEIVLSQVPVEGEGGNPFAAAADPAAGGGASDPGAAAAEGQDPAKPAEKKPDADDLVLDLIRRGRALTQREKAIEGRERTVAERVKPYEDLFASAKKDPMSFIERVADAAGLDVDTVVEVYTARKSGAQAKLPDDHPVRALQAEVAELKRQLAEKDTKQTDAAADAAVQGHINDLKALAGQTPDAYKLFNTAPEEHAYQAFDLMAAHHRAKQPITHAEAVRRIEVVLREDAEKKAAALGYSKPAAAAAPATPSPTPQSAAPRASTPTPAPLEHTSAIRSDEEIAAEWLRMTRGAA